MQLLISEDQNQIEVSTGIKSLLKKALEKVLSEEAFSKEFIAAAEVSMVFVDDHKMAELNEHYRGVSGTTDVLSFPMLDDEEDQPEGPGEFLLGDIVISVSKAFEQSKEYGHSLDREMAFLAVHGMLHLMGYDHEKSEAAELKMREKERRVLDDLGLKMGSDEDGKA